MTPKPVVLVGVDGSPASLHALDWAAAEARLRGHALRIVHSHTLPVAWPTSLDGDQAYRAARSILDDAAARVLARGPLEVETAVETGDAGGVMIARSHEAGLAVVGTRGRGGFTNALLGTVSSALPAHAACPTVVVPLRGTPRGQQVPPDAPVPDVHPVRRILVGVDGSPQADIALRYALREATLWGAEVTAVAGVPLAANTGVLMWVPVQIDQEKVLVDAAVALDVVVDRALVDHPGLTVKREVLNGTGTELLINLSPSTDLIVVGSRGRGGFKGMLLGSTSQAVLHHAVCPVMVVTSRCADQDL